MSATITFKMREPLAARLARAADVTGLRPDDLARFAIAHLVATVEERGRLGLRDCPLFARMQHIPEDAVPVWLPEKIVASLSEAAEVTDFEDGVNGGTATGKEVQP